VRGGAGAATAAAAADHAGRLPLPEQGLHPVSGLLTWGKKSVTRDRCYDFLNIFAKKIGEIFCVFVSKQS
jgi:hypothetical protein